jgi:hypothetical protein
MCCARFREQLARRAFLDETATLDDNQSLAVPGNDP